MPLEAPKLQYSHDPALQLARPQDAAFGVVQDAAVNGGGGTAALAEGGRG